MNVTSVRESRQLDSTFYIFLDRMLPRMCGCKDIARNAFSKTRGSSAHGRKKKSKSRSQEQKTIWLA